MKQISILFSFLLISTNSYASNIGDDHLALIDNESVTFTLLHEAQREFILTSDYNKKNNHIQFEFESDVLLIQIINADEEVEMVFPVSAKKVNLGLSLFDPGSYKMGFLIEGEQEIQFTSISLK